MSDCLRTETKAAEAASQHATGRTGLLQRKCACGASPGLTGQCEECRRGRLVGMQMKTEASEPGDHFEQEADRLAERVMGMPQPQPSATVPRGAAHDESVAAPTAVHDALRSTGQPLDTSTRSLMESRFGHDFSRVRVHADSHAARAARSVSAQAYTVGQDVVFGAGRYAPATGTGQWLLAHELAHVVQQRASGPALQRKLIVDEDAKAAGPSLKAALERLAGRALVASDQGLALAEGKQAGGSPTIAHYIERAIASGQTYRLRWKPAQPATQQPPTPQPQAQPQPQPQQQPPPQQAQPQAPAQPQPQAQTQPQAGTVEQVSGEIVITIDRSMLGEFTWTPDEILAEQLVAAVAKFDPSKEAAPAAKRSSTGAPLPEMSEDALLSKTAEMDSGERHDRLCAFANARLTHLSAAQRSLICEVGWMTKGVPLTEIIRGVETNTPFRAVQQTEGDRVTITYIDPRLLDPKAPVRLNQIMSSMSRHVTFVPGADASAPPAGMPKTGEACTAAEQRSGDNSCCTPQMLAEFGGDLSAARAAVARAVKRLEGKELIDCNVRPNFGSQSSPAQLAQIADRLRVAGSELFVSRHGWRCRPKGSGLADCEKRTLEGGQEGTVGASVERGKTAINVCVNDHAPFTDWVTLLHEVMHRVGVHGTEHYKAGSGYPGDDPLSNADSYAHLVEDLGGDGWSPCKPWPVDLKGIAGYAPGSGVVLGARIEFSPLGPGVRVVDWTVGANFLWLPKFGVASQAGDKKEDVLARGYLGAETGARLTLPNKYGTLAFEAAGGVGILGEPGNVQPAASARAGGSFRFGKALSGVEVGLDLARLQTIAGQANGEWIIGLSAGYHIGKPEKRK